MTAEFKPCSVDGCAKNSHPSARGVKGYCQAHYFRVRRHGSPHEGRTPDGEPMRFVHEVALPYRGAECLVWPFGKLKKGYGHINVDGRSHQAHRYICTIVHGMPPSPTHEAAHSCGKGHLGCVNPIHLEWKTGAENCADKLIHGTHNRGERHSMVKLTEKEAREILSLKGVMPQRSIAAAFGISKGAVCAIHSRRTWSVLDDPHSKIARPA